MWNRRLSLLPVVLAALLVGACATTGDDPSYDAEEPELAPDTAAGVESLSAKDFKLPALTAEERAAIVVRYAHLDPEGDVPRGLLEDAIVFHDVNLSRITNGKFLTVVDFSRPSSKDRFFLIDTVSGEVEKHKVAHGSGSDPDHDGKATKFSNVEGSHMSSLGFYATGEIYSGNHPHSMRLDGLSPDGSPNGMANTRARQRAVVMHEASYVNDHGNGVQGRSNGCLALDPDIERSVVDRIHGGSIIYVALTPLAEPIGPGGGEPVPAPSDPPPGG